MKKLIIVLMLLFTSTLQALDDNDFKKNTLDAYAAFERNRNNGKPSITVSLTCWELLKQRNSSGASACIFYEHIGAIFEGTMSEKYGTPISSSYTTKAVTDRTIGALLAHGFSLEETQTLIDFVFNDMKDKHLSEILAHKIVTEGQ